MSLTASRTDDSVTEPGHCDKNTRCKRRQTQTQTCTELTCFTSFLLSKPFNILSNSCCGKFPLRRWISFRQIPAPNVICTLRTNYTTKPNVHHKSLLNRFCTCQGHCVAFFHTVWPEFLCNWYRWFLSYNQVGQWTDPISLTDDATARISRLKHSPRRIIHKCTKIYLITLSSPSITQTSCHWQK